MSRGVLTLCIILGINTLVTIVYCVVSSLRMRRDPGLAARCIVMLLCPCVGPVYFGLCWVLRTLFFHKPVDLTDVIFTKDREKTLLKADEAGESGIVPVEDAVTVVDKQNARVAMLEVLRHDIRKSLSSIFVALDSEDSEISHYAASMLQSELGKFRVGVQEIASQIDLTENELREAEEYDGQMKTPAGVVFSKRLFDLGIETAVVDDARLRGDDQKADDKDEKTGRAFQDLSSGLDMSEEYARREKSAHEQGLRAFYGSDEEALPLEQKLVLQVDAAHKLIEDLREVLRQKVLPEIEIAQYTELSDRMARLLEKRDTLSASEMSWVAECYLLRGDRESCREWSDRLSLVYPETLEAYSTKLKLLYDEGRWEQFSETMTELRSSGIPLDSEIMELVRVFN